MRAATRVAMVGATLVGATSMMLLGLFLFFGPFGLVELGLSRAQRLTLDALLCLTFCVQHSVMVRQAFRQRVLRIVRPPYYGAFYAFTSGVLLLALVVFWQESAVVIVKLDGATRWMTRALFLAALPGLVWSARSIPQFDPFGIGLLEAHLRDRPPRSWPFTVRGPYRWVRHPQYSLVLVLLWAYPDLTVDRLIFNGILSAWMVLGTVLEERDLVEQFGDDYVEYQQRVPMLIPWRIAR